MHSSEMKRSAARLLLSHAPAQRSDFTMERWKTQELTADRGKTTMGPGEKPSWSGPVVFRALLYGSVAFQFLYSVIAVLHIDHLVTMVMATGGGVVYPFMQTAAAK